MELKTKYQYTSFLYPYIIAEEKYSNYLLKLLKDPQCQIKYFERERDYNIYSYFLPVMRQYLFWSFGWSKNKQKEFEELDKQMQSVILAKNPCTMFTYDIGKNIQGKIGEKNGIFFKIQKIEIICFHTGICFIHFKTNIEESNQFGDVLNFNYKFRDINSEFIGLKEYENIKIQTDIFKAIKELSTLIQEIAGNNQNAKNLNLDVDRFLTYAYTCVEQENWSTEEEFEGLQHEFAKYSNVLPSNANSSFEMRREGKGTYLLNGGRFVKCGFTKVGTGLLCSGADTANYTKLPFAYENEYFYTYILMLYKKIYLKKLNTELKKNNKSKRMREKFMYFTQNIWIQEITNDTTGNAMIDAWEDALETKNVFFEVKNKYDIFYKELNIEKNTKVNVFIGCLLAITLLANLINMMTFPFRK